MKSNLLCGSYQQITNRDFLYNKEITEAQKHTALHLEKIQFLHRKEKEQSHIYLESLKAVQVRDIQVMSETEVHK